MNGLKMSMLGRRFKVVLFVHFHEKLNWRSDNLSKRISFFFTSVFFFFFVSGEIYCLMEQRKTSVEELDSVPLDHV